MPKQKKQLSLIILFLSCIYLYQSIPSLSQNIKNIMDRGGIIISAERNSYKNIIRNDTELHVLLGKFTDFFEDNNQLTYLYIDTSDETGTMNYYKMRYNLIPAKSVKYQYYGYTEFSEDWYIELINRFKVDYILIHRDNGILDAIGPNLKNEEDIIFKVVHIEGESLSEMVEKF